MSYFFLSLELWLGSEMEILTLFKVFWIIHKPGKEVGVICLSDMPKTSNWIFSEIHNDLDYDHVLIFKSAYYK